MKIKSAVFLGSAPDLKSCPRSVLPEIAVIGRSNVGKSSLINLLTETKDLARASGTPGKTRLINFFTINGSWTLVDLPGYGFAKVAKEDRSDFNVAVANYLEKRAPLRLVFVLIDSRHPPQAIDLEFLSWLNGVGTPYAIVFTKTDKLSSSQLGSALAAYKKALVQEFEALPPTFESSSVSKVGRGELLKHIEKVFKEKSSG